MDAGIIDKARSVLRLEEINVADSPKVLRIEVEPAADSTGEDVLRVLAVLAPDTTDTSLETGGPDLLRRIRSLVSNADVPLRVHVHLEIDGDPAGDSEAA